MTGGPVRYTPTRPTPVTASAATSSSEWTVVDEAGLPLSVPEGGDRKFTLGLLRGRTFLDVTLKDKLQYFSIRGSKKLNPEQIEYAQWVEDHFTAHKDRSANGGTIDVWLTLKPAMPRQEGYIKMACAHPDVHHKGSSARYIRSTCNTCKKVWQEERNVPSQDSAQCQHRRTDHRGSNKQVRKTYCLDCGTYIDSVSQAVVKSISEDPDKTQVWVSTEERAMLDRVGEHDTIRRDEIVAAAQMMLIEAQQLDGGDYTLLSIGNMFIDCADRVLADRKPPAPSAPAASAAPTVPAAMTFSRERNALVATLHKDRSTTSLRVVDPYADPHVWAIVDDGCNSCTHSDAWRINAEEKWKKLGFKCYVKDKKITTFSGVGSAPSTGKWEFPCAFQLIQSQVVLPGTLASHEIADSKHPLLLSQSCQAMLGFTKSSRSGAITLDDYSDQNLEVVRQAKTGLFMVRMDHLARKHFEKNDNKLMRSVCDDRPWNYEDNCPQQTEASPNRTQDKDWWGLHGPQLLEACGYVATPSQTKSQKHGKPFPKHILEAKTVVVSCGMTNFEDSNYSNGKSNEFAEWNRGYRIERGHLNRYPEGKEKFLRSFKTNFPELCHDRNIVLIDCTPYYNPEKDRRLRLHTGRHPDNLGEIVASDDYAKVNAPLKNLDPEGKNLIINVCKSGRHRAVANEESQLNPVQTILYGVKYPSSDGKGDLAEGLDLQAETHWGHMCGRECEKCRRCNPENEPSFNKAFEILQEIIPRPVYFHWRPPASAAAPSAPWKKRDRDQLEFALGHRLEFVSIEAEQAARKRIREFEAEAQKPEEPLDHRDPRRTP